ncbi:MAG: peptidoglycan editing factor PgeF [Oscillospiraceae bacterium]|nr:peptidoglycan editing factor PgeF [Oscillospiraceae bacterium]
MAFIENNKNGITYMTASNISVPHAFTTRFGGVSKGIYESMNLGQNVGDDAANVNANYMSLCEALNIKLDNIVCTKQVHGNSIRVASHDDCGRVFLDIPYEADGLITNSPGLSLAIFIADCVPILLYDEENQAIAAVHAGWRGTAIDIVGAAIKGMTEAYGSNPKNIRGAIGPSISVCCYETDADVPEALANVLGNDVSFCVKPMSEKFMVDLKNANRLLLEKAGVIDIDISQECTSCQSDKYWSHRKTNGNRGSQAAIISI